MHTTITQVRYATSTLQRNKNNIEYFKRSEKKSRKYGESDSNSRKLVRA
jgi:hypothetical protein